MGEVAAAVAAWGWEEWLAATAIGVGAGASAASVNMQAQSAQAQRRAMREQQKAEEMRRIAESRERYRQLRRERAAAIQRVEDLGASSSTSGQAVVSSTQTAGNIAQGFADVTGRIADRINAFNISAAKKASLAQMNKSIADMSFSLASFGMSAGGFGKTGNTTTQRPTTDTTPRMGGLY